MKKKKKKKKIWMAKKFIRVCPERCYRKLNELLANPTQNCHAILFELTYYSFREKTLSCSLRNVQDSHTSFFYKN